MLELTAACAESAAQLVTRRAPPLLVRSNRLLQPHFWRNEAPCLHRASWWSAYLESVRQIPQARPRAHVVQCRRQAEPSTARDRRRAFSHSSSPGSVSPKLGVDGQHVHVQEQAIPRDFGDEEPKAWLPTEETGPLDPNVEHLQNLLGPDPKPELAQRRRDKAWDIWVSLPDQERFASRLLGKFAQAKNATDLDHAIQAYSIIPEDERTVEDYAAAISAAIARHRYAEAFKVCNESLARDKGLEPAQTLLLCCLRQRLWKNASRAWRSFFAGRRSNDLDWSVVDNDPDLVSVAAHLLKRLDTADLVLAADVPTLKQLASVLVTRVAASERAMAAITPEGILQIYNLAKALGILRPSHFTLALSNLCNSLRARVRVDLALLIYGAFRSNFSTLSEGVFIGLLRLCFQAKCKPETFDYIMSEYGEFHVPKTKSYNIVMMSMAHEANVDEVERYFDDYRQATGRPVDLLVLVPRLYVHAITGDVTQTKVMLEQIRSEYGLEPDLVCWNILLYAHCRSADPQGAFDAFDEMIGRGVQPDAYTFCTLTAIASNSGDTPRVLSLLDLAGKYGVARHGDMVASVVHSLCLNGNGDEAREFAERATLSGVHGSAVRIWNNLLRHYAFLTDTKTMARIEKTMRRFGVEPDAMTYAARMTALVRKSKTAHALRLLRHAHVNGHVVANAFHYSILIHGFAMEKNRDMVLALYKEMEERFPRVTPSARLAMLYSQLHRDWDNGLQRLVTSPRMPNAALSLPNAQAAARDSILETSMADMVTKEPQPGFRRRTPQSALSSISTEALIDSFMADAQVERSVQAMNTMLPASQRTRPGMPPQPESIELLTTRMFVATHKHDWRAVDTIWCGILASAVKRGLAFNAPPQLVSQLHSLQTSVTNAEQFCDKCRDLLAAHGLKVLPASRFVLSRALSRYIQALELQPALSDRLKRLIAALTACGFELSSKNWNSAVQALCKSSLEHDHLTAFGLFQDKFLARLPTYRNLFSSTYANPAQIARGRQADVAKRKLTEQTNPGVLIPTYFTVVYLASTLRRKSGSDFVDQASSLFPKTYQYVKRLPYKADRIQGVLLRGRPGRGNAIKRPREATFVDVAGVAGSKAAVDRVSSDVLDEIASKLPPLPPPRRKKKADIDAVSGLEIGSAIKGEPVLGKKLLPGVNRDESEASRLLRLKRERADRLDAAQRLIHDLTLDRLSGNDYIGDPSHVSKARAQDVPVADPSAVGSAVLEAGVGQQPDKASLPASRQLEPRGCLLSRTLRPRVKAPRRRRRPVRRMDDGRNSKLLRAYERARVMAMLKVRRAARRLLRSMPRMRDLDFQARVASREGDMARVEHFLRWAANPVFEWRREARSLYQNRRIWQVLETHVPGFHDAGDRFALKTIDRLLQKPGDALAGGLHHLVDPPVHLRPKTPGVGVERRQKQSQRQKKASVPPKWSRPGVAKRVARSTGGARQCSRFDPWGSTVADKFAVVDQTPGVAVAAAGQENTQARHGQLDSESRRE